MWKVLLGFRPPEASAWEVSLAASRASYQDLLSELIVDPGAREDPQPLPPRRLAKRPLSSSSATPSSPSSSPHRCRPPPSSPLFSSPPPSPSPTPSNKKSLAHTLLSSLLGQAGAGGALPALPAPPALTLRMPEVAASRVQDHPLSQAPLSAWRG